MCKKIITIALSLLCIGSVNVAAETTPLFDSDSKTLVLENVDVAKTYDDQDALVFDMTFTNKETEPTNAVFAYFPKLFQNGIQLDSGILSDSHYSELTAKGITDIKDGASIEYAVCYVLSDTENIVEVSIEDDIFDGNKIDFVVTFEDGKPIVNFDDVELPEVQNWEQMYYDLLEEYEALKTKYEG